MWNLRQSTVPETLELYIYGDVQKYDIDWQAGSIKNAEASANHFREELAKHPDVKQINLFINSYGGSVFEGTAIYNQLRRHPAEKTSYIDGFACSVAAVIAMVGKVVMPKNAMLMIHNIWLGVVGNAKELRKAADDLDVIMQGNRQAFIQKIGDKLTEERLIEMLDNETWLTAEKCIEFGFADEYAQKDADMSHMEEALQKMNITLSQKIQIHKALSGQYKQLIDPITPVILKTPEPISEPEPDIPAQNKIINLFAAYDAGKGK
jgi:ATP-dependent protease ClpP protease subunit